MLANVAAILSAMCPDLPRPITIILPLQFSHASQASTKLLFKVPLRFLIAADSMSNTLFATLM